MSTFERKKNSKALAFLRVVLSLILLIGLGIVFSKGGVAVRESILAGNRFTFIGLIIFSVIVEGSMIYFYSLDPEGGSLLAFIPLINFIELARCKMGSFISFIIGSVFYLIFLSLALFKLDWLAVLCFHNITIINTILFNLPVIAILLLVLFRMCIALSVFDIVIYRLEEKQLKTVGKINTTLLFIDVLIFMAFISLPVIDSLSFSTLGKTGKLQKIKKPKTEIC